MSRQFEPKASPDRAGLVRRARLAWLVGILALGGLVACSGGSGDDAATADTVESADQPTETGEEPQTDTSDDTGPETTDQPTAGDGAQWVAAQAESGADGSVAATIITSEDGATWAEAGTIDGVHITGLAWGDGRWLAVGVGPERSSIVYSSSDLEQWEEVADLEWTIETIAYGDGLWVAAGNASSGATAGGAQYATPVVYTSSDGTTWTEIDLPPLQYAPQMQLLRSASHGPDGWVVSGIDASAMPELDGELSFSVSHHTSADGVAWVKDDILMATTDGPRVALANDGTQWVEAAETFTFDPEGEGYGGRFVDAALTAEPRGEAEAIPDTPFEATPADDLAYGDGQWLAVTNGPPTGELLLDGQLAGPTAFFASTDGRSWEKVADWPEVVSALAYGGGEPEDEPAPPTTSVAAPTTGEATPAEPPCTVEALQEVPVSLVEGQEPYVVESALCNGEWAVAETTEGRFQWSRLFQWTGEAWVEVVARPCFDGTLPPDIEPIACPVG